MHLLIGGASRRGRDRRGTTPPPGRLPMSRARSRGPNLFRPRQLPDTGVPVPFLLLPTTFSPWCLPLANPATTESASERSYGAVGKASERKKQTNKQTDKKKLRISPHIPFSTGAVPISRPSISPMPPTTASLPNVLLLARFFRTGKSASPPEATPQGPSRGRPKNITQIRPRTARRAVVQGIPSGSKSSNSYLGRQAIRYDSSGLQQDPTEKNEVKREVLELHCVGGRPGVDSHGCPIFDIFPMLLESTPRP